MRRKFCGSLVCSNRRSCPIRSARRCGKSSSDACMSSGTPKAQTSNCNSAGPTAIRTARGRGGGAVALKADVLVTAGTPAAAASRATSTIPIVMATGVGLGTQLTDGSEQPCANVTGISDLPPGVSEQRLRLLREAWPDAALAILADRGNPSSPLALRETQAAAKALGITVSDY